MASQLWFFYALSASWTIPAMVLIGALTVVRGNYLILQIIAEKNATLASMIEMTYPLLT